MPRVDDLTALRAAERRGSYTREESRAVADALGVPESEITAMTYRPGSAPEQW